MLALRQALGPSTSALLHAYSVLLQFICNPCGVIAKLTDVQDVHIVQTNQAAHQQFDTVNSLIALSPVHDVQLHVSFMLDHQSTILFT